jgi:hypothetical protein
MISTNSKPAFPNSTCLSVYISSTFSDLSEYRHEVAKTIKMIGMQTLQLEEMIPSGISPLDECRRLITEADTVVILVAHRYGYVPEGQKKSLTEIEFREARALNKPLFVFMLDDNTSWPIDQIEGYTNTEVAERLSAFKKELRETCVVEYFSSPANLSKKVAVSFAHYLGRSISELEEPEPEEIPDKGPIIEELRQLREEMRVFQDHMMKLMRIRVPAIQQGNQSDLEVRPCDFLGTPSSEVITSQCFVIMPYSESWSKGVEDTIKELCEKNNLSFKIAKQMKGRFIPNDIWRGVTGSGLIIADLSGGNPNVAYELGLTDVLGREVVLICQDDEVPFDFSGQRMITYEDSIGGLIALREGLTDVLREYAQRINSASR